ncbi:hypothetical protein [Kribbella sp. NPDC004875]|uniref:hypothetical protein n=1 Tax=Kribbella sp. NPDC004875 TaxID=3364107 RepID=UPI0036C89DE0
MDENPADPRRRPVVLRSAGSADEPTHRSRRYLAWAGTGVLGLVAAAGLVAGGTAVWSAFDPGTPGNSPAPLWFPPPETITPQSEKIAPTPTRSTPDDHGGDRTRTPRVTRTSEPGDDKGGHRTTAPSTTKSTSGKHGTGGGTSGKSSDDGPNHH